MQFLADNESRRDLVNILYNANDLWFGSIPWKENDCVFTKHLHEIAWPRWDEE